MCIECNSEILKGDWRIIMRRVDIVATCIVLHNMYIIDKDKFDLK